MTQKELIQLLNIAKNQMHIADDVWRDQMLPRHGALPDQDGRVSLNTVPLLGQQALLKELQQKGFKVYAKAAAHKDTGWRKPYLAKLTLVWGLMFEHGVVRQAGDAALRHWAKKYHSGADRLEWAKRQQLSAAIDALNAWAVRDGFELVRKGRKTELHWKDS
jgi:hypothetical protein